MSHRLAGVFGTRWAKWLGTAGLSCGLVVFGVGLVWPLRLPDTSCAGGLGLLASAGLLLTLVSGIWLGVTWAYAVQCGWVLLATLCALDAWIVFGMVMMHLNHAPEAPDALLTLAFFLHGVCMFLTTMWAFHARDVSTIGQIRAGEAGRSIAAVWVFLASYVVAGFFYHEQGLFASTAGGAVVSALTISALALTMGSGYTSYRLVMYEEAPAVLDTPEG